MVDDLEVVVEAGSLRSGDAGAVAFPHRWTADGVSVDATFTGAHLLHLAVAGCVLNDLYREAGRLAIELGGVRVRATGGFDPDDGWASTGIRYTVELDTPADPDRLAHLLETVDTVAEIPRALRAGADVRRVEGPS